MVNETTTKTAHKGSIDLIGHLLKCIIHAFAKVREGNKIIMAKWDV